MISDIEWRGIIGNTPREFDVSVRCKDKTELAIARGYQANEEGDIFHPERSRVNVQMGSARYFHFEIWHEKKMVKILAHRFVWRFLKGPIPPGFHIHHVNEFRTDNRLSNLECLSPKDHRERHKL